MELIDRSSSRRARWTARLAVVTAVAASLAIVLEPAGAVPTIVQVSETSSSDSGASKSIPAMCPNTHPKLVGTGVEIVGGNGQVLIEGIVPNALLTGVEVQAREDFDGYAGEWAVRAHAICTSLSLSLYRVVAVNPGAASTEFAKSAVAPCGGDNQLLGTGATINGGQGQVALDDILPNQALTAVTVWALEIGGNPTWSVSAYGICTSSPVDVEREYHTNSSDVPVKSGTAACDPGYQLVGTGAELIAAGGRAVIDDITPNGSNIAAPTKVRVWAIEREDDPDWSVRAWGICLTTPAG